MFINWRATREKGRSNIYVNCRLGSDCVVLGLIRDGTLGPTLNFGYS